MSNNQNSIGKPFTRILYFTPKPDLKKHKKDGHMVCCIWRDWCDIMWKLVMPRDMSIQSVTTREMVICFKITRRCHILWPLICINSLKWSNKCILNIINKLLSHLSYMSRPVLKPKFNLIFSWNIFVS